MTPRRQKPARSAASAIRFFGRPFLPARPRARRPGPCAVLPFVLCAAALGVVSAEAARDDKDAGDKARRPTLSLRANPPLSFSPARVVVTGELRGGADHDAELYCPDVEWDWGDDTRSESKQNCEPFVEGESTVTRRWTTSHTYTRAGRYQAFLRLKRGGKVIVAGNVRIEVRPGAGDLGDFDR